MCALHDHEDLVTCGFHASLPGHLRLCWSRMSWPGAGEMMERLPSTSSSQLLEDGPTPLQPTATEEEVCRNCKVFGFNRTLHVP